jgi:hypothetical protein
MIHDVTLILDSQKQSLIENVLYLQYYSLQCAGNIKDRINLPFGRTNAKSIFLFHAIWLSGFNTATPANQLFFIRWCRPCDSLMQNRGDIPGLFRWIMYTTVGWGPFPAGPLVCSQSTCLRLIGDSRVMFFLFVSFIIIHDCVVQISCKYYYDLVNIWW